MCASLPFPCDLEPLLHWWSDKVIDWVSLLSPPHPNSQPIHPSSPDGGKRCGTKSDGWVWKSFFSPAVFLSGGKWKDKGEDESRDDPRDRGRDGQISRLRCPNIRLFCLSSIWHWLKAHLYNCWSQERPFDLISHDCRPQESLFLSVHHLICPPFFQIFSRFSLHIYLESVKCKGGCFAITTLFFLKQLRWCQPSAQQVYCKVSHCVPPYLTFWTPPPSPPPHYPAPCTPPPTTSHFQQKLRVSLTTRITPPPACSSTRCAPATTLTCSSP